jgi:ABC-type lipoprotein export system ATPase subunit
MIQLSAITKKYHDGVNSFNHVLCGVDLRIEKGEFIAIRGASGSGKTTLLSILGTLLQPDGGSYELEGVKINTEGMNYSTLRNKKIGFVFQNHLLMPSLTALENILLPTLAFQEAAEDWQIEYAKQLIDTTGIASIAQQYPETLSGGEACRVALCRALIMKPLLLLADEPTGLLDAENARNVALLLKKLNVILETTIVMVTHSEEMAAVANRVLVLKEGLLIFPVLDLKTNTCNE